MSDFLIRSLVLSVALTVLLNVFVAFRNRRADRDLFGRRPGPEPARPTVDIGETAADRPTVRFFFPWKAMLIASIGLTVFLNLVAWLAR